MRERVGKRDLILLICILAAILAVWTGYRIRHRAPGAEAKVTVDGELYGTYPLDTDREIVIRSANGGSNLLVIRDGKADMTKADCPDKLCVRQRPARADGDTIVCLPHQVVVEVIGGERSDFDAVAQ